LVHSGRVKDISRAVELYTRLWKATGRPTSLQLTLSRYATVMASLEKTPLIMSRQESLFVYSGKSFSEWWAGVKNKIYSSLAPKSWYEKSFLKTMGIKRLSTGTDIFSVKTTGLPPTPSSRMGYFLSAPSGILSTSLSTKISSYLSTYRSPEIKKSYQPSSSKSFNQVLQLFFPTYYKQISEPLSISTTMKNKIILSMKSTSYKTKALVPPSSSVSPSPYSPYYSPYYFSSSISPFAFFPGLYGRGRKYPGEDLWGRYYRKREFKIPSIQQLFGIRVNKNINVNLKKMLKIGF